MKIAVIGAGAIGSIVGGLLSKAGEDVTLVGRKEYVEAVNKNGLIIDGALGKLNLRIKAKEQLDFKPDMVLLTAKTQDVQEAAREIKPYLVSGVPVVTMQNGVRSDELVGNILGKENVISCVVILGGTFLEPGKVIYSPKGVLVVGEPFGCNDKRAKDIAAVLNKAILTYISKDIRGAHWAKLIINLNNAIPAATGLSVQEVSASPQLGRLSILLMKEGLKTVKLSDIKLSSLPKMPVSILNIMASMPVPVALFMLKMMSKSMGSIPVHGSTLQSIKRGKSTEIDYLNGEIVELGRKSGIPTPYNTAIVEAVHNVEAGSKFFEADELAAICKMEERR